MRLPIQFTRVVTAGPTLWTLDVLPKDVNGNFLPPGTAPANTNNAALNDNVIGIKTADRTGVVVNALAIAYAGPTSAPDLVVDIYAWDDRTKSYYRVNATAGAALKQGVLNTYSVPVISDAPVSLKNVDQALAGGVQFVIIVTPSGTIVGNYSFAVGAVV